MSAGEASAALDAVGLVRPPCAASCVSCFAFRARRTAREAGRGNEDTEEQRAVARGNGWRAARAPGCPAARRTNRSAIGPHSVRIRPATAAASGSDKS
ncbi:hypothetical protein X946_5457 [Burkholderia sp. ABCPW 111]|nr:hypothetical protein X946_5457 [Burkholderia sp. ABCPW 111]